MTDALDQEAQTILQALIAIPFDNCSPVEREFPTLTKRHRIEGVLYISKVHLMQITVDGQRGILLQERIRDRLL